MKMISCARASQVLEASLSAAASPAARSSVKCPLRLSASRVRAVIVALAFVALTAPAAFGNCSPTSATEICLEHTLPTLPAGLREVV